MPVTNTAAARTSTQISSNRVRAGSLMRPRSVLDPARGIPYLYRPCPRRKRILLRAKLHEGVKLADPDDSNYGKYLGLGLEMAVGVLLGFGVGWWLDKHFGWS